MLFGGSMCVSLCVSLSVYVFMHVRLHVRLYVCMSVGNRSSRLADVCVASVHLEVFLSLALRHSVVVRVLHTTLSLQPTINRTHTQTEHGIILVLAGPANIALNCLHRITLNCVCG